MKILIITPTIYEYPDRIGGAETYVDSLAASLAKSVTVGILGFSIKKSGKWNKGNVNYNVFKSFPIKNNPSNPLPIFNYFELLKWDIIYIQQFHTWLTFVCIILGKLFGKKIILTDHNGGGATFNRKLKIDRYIDLFLTTSYLSMNEIKLTPQKNYAIYGGVDLKKFIPGADQREGILFVGRAHKIKGIIPFLKSVADYDTQTKITLAVGVNFENTEYFKEIEDFIKNNRLINCLVKKNIPLDELIREYQKHQWTILPSIDETPHESLGLTVLESLACDTPVAVSPFCGVCEMFENQQGSFVHILNDHSYFLENISSTSPSGARLWCEKNASWDVVSEKVLREIHNLKKIKS